jgi:adenylate cyclase class 2
MKEIEILVEIKSSKDDVIKALADFEAHGIKRIVDLYFVDPLRGELKPDENGRLRACFRLRKKDGKASVAYKNDYFGDNDEWLYSDEHETKIDDFDIMAHIIESLGFKELVRIDNEKYTFTTPDYEIVFEDVKDLGYFLEVEKLQEVPDDQVAKIKAEIREFITGLGMKIGKEMNAGKPELMLSQRDNK